MSDFWLGFVVGFISAGIFGLVMRWFALRQAEWQDMDKPQKVVTVTKKTPWQVILTGLKAGFLIVFAILLIGVLVWVLIESPW